MLRRIGSYMKYEASGLNEAALLVAASTFSSQLLALVRDRLLASSFAGTPELDVYYAAFRLPDLVFYAIGSFLSASVLIPFLSKEREPKLLLGELMTVFLSFLSILALLVFVLAPVVAPLLVPGFSPASRDLYVQMVRILLVSPFLFGVSSLFGSIVQMRSRFVSYAVAPLLYNASIVAAILLLAPRYGIYGVLWGVLGGAFLHMGSQYLVVREMDEVPRLQFVTRYRELAGIAGASIFRTLALSVSQIEYTLLLSLATLSGPGSVALFTFAYNLQGVPVSLAGTSYAVAAFPFLSRHAAQNQSDLYRAKLAATLRSVLVLSAFCACIAILFSRQIVALVFQGGLFTEGAVLPTALALSLFATSTIAQSVSAVCIRALYAKGQTYAPFVANLTSIFVTVGLAWWFLYTPVVLHGAERFLLLAGAFSLGAWFNALLLSQLFGRYHGEGFFAGTRATIRRVVFSVVVAGALGVVVQSPHVMGIVPSMHPLIVLCGQVGLVGLVYVWLLLALGDDTMEGLKSALQGRLFGVKQVLPDLGETPGGTL